MENIFSNPMKYIEELRKIQLIDIKNDIEFSGKSIAVIFLTRYCNADCKFCIYKSPMKQIKEVTREDELDKVGIENSIEFINKSNIGYLMISGGGEPFLKIEHIFNLIEKSNVKDIIIVSNGFWANNYDRALNILNKIHKIQEEHKKKITIRISIDKWHSENLGVNYIKNIIDIFLKNFKDNSLKLKIHTITDDKTVFDILNETNCKYNIKYQEEYSSDNSTLNKANRHRMFLQFFNGYELEIEFAKLFKPSLEVDLNKDIEEQMNVFSEDLEKSQAGNFSTVINSDGTKGLDFLINYNGNISTWSNYQTYNSPNLYMDNYETIVNKVFNDLISYSFLKESLDNIMKIVERVNSIAVKRAIGINIRDYFGMYLLYENKTLLYYYVILLKKYMSENMIINLEQIPREIKDVIELNEEALIEFYNSSEYTIITQYKEREFVKEEWEDLFFLISKGHFILNNIQIKEAVDYYNENTSQKYENYKEIIKNNNENRYKRLLKRFNV